MKQNRMIILLTMAVTLFLASSCKKDSGTISTDSANAAYPKIMHLPASEWTLNQDGLWVILLRNVIPQGHWTNSKVYLVTGGNEIPLDRSVSFMGGQLWAKSTDGNVSIFFHYLLGALPFQSLDIKVVIL